MSRKENDGMYVHFIDKKEKEYYDCVKIRNLLWIIHFAVLCLGFQESNLGKWD